MKTDTSFEVSSKIKNVVNKFHGPATGVVFGTYEWATRNANFIDGCKHDCKYCYSKAMAIRFGRRKASDWKNEKVRKNNLLKKFSRISGTIMFPSSHDIQPDYLEYALMFLENILTPGNTVLIVTKPHWECIRTICDEFERFKDNILFRFTIGSSNSDTLRFWEPGAPDFDERLACLESAYYRGFQTSVSCEPMLDNNIEDVIVRVMPFITDAIWIGKANALMQRLRVNDVADRETIMKAHELMRWQSDENIAALYNRLKDNPQIKWKESVKSIIGIKIPTQKGLDI